MDYGYTSDPLTSLRMRLEQRGDPLGYNALTQSEWMATFDALMRGEEQRQVDRWASLDRYELGSRRFGERQYEVVQALEQEATWHAQHADALRRIQHPDIVLRRVMLDAAAQARRMEARRFRLSALELERGAGVKIPVEQWRAAWEPFATAFYAEASWEATTFQANPDLTQADGTIIRRHAEQSHGATRDWLRKILNQQVGLQKSLRGASRSALDVAIADVRMALGYDDPAPPRVPLVERVKARIVLNLKEIGLGILGALLLWGAVWLANR